MSMAAAGMFLALNPHALGLVLLTLDVLRRKTQNFDTKLPA
jgi:hypothetical protein